MAKRKKSLKQRVLDYFKKNPGKDALDVAEYLKIELGTAASLINDLLHKGKLDIDVQQ